jgi:glycerol-1-phosphate dehydrogenase [NAD(P)+]
MLAATARKESGIKHIDSAGLRIELARIKSEWPALAASLRMQLLSPDEAAGMLREAGAPSESAEIGIPRERLKRSYIEAYHVRRRYTVLDLAHRTGFMRELLDNLFPAEAHP